MSNLSLSCFVNTSRESLHQYAWMVDNPGDPNFDTVGNGYVIATFISLFLLLGLPWNAMVIIVIIYKRLYTQPTVILMLNLTITNLLLCVLVMPFHIISGIAGEYVFGSSDYIRCQVCQTGVLTIILPWVSVHTISLMSVDRFLYLKKPFKYNTIVTPKRMIAAIVLVWFICIALSIPPLFGFGSISFGYVVASCVPLLVGESHYVPNYYYAMLLLMEALIPVIIVFVMYIWILCITRKSLLQTTHKVESDETNQNHHKKEFRLVQLFGAIFTANIVTWIPMVGLVITAAILGELHTVSYTIVYLSYLSETVIHPVIEATLIREIRDTISKSLRYFIERSRMCYSNTVVVDTDWNEESTVTKHSDDTLA